jgi:hypothetical protein
MGQTALAADHRLDFADYRGKGPVCRLLGILVRAVRERSAVDIRALRVIIH